MAELARASGKLTAAQDFVRCAVSGMGGVSVQVLDTFSGTITFEASTNGTTFQALRVTPSNSTTAVTTATSAGLWTASATGYLAVQARMSSFVSGAPTVIIQASLASPGGGASGGGGGGGTSSTFGDPFPADGTAAGFINASGNMAGANLDASGYLKVNVAAGSSGNAAASATGSAVPASADYLGVKDSAGNLLGVAASNLDYDSGAGTVGQTIFGLALPGSGGPVAGGTNTNPIQIGDAGGSITVDGTVTAAQATAANLNATVVQATGTNLHVVTDATSTTAVTQTTSPWVVAGGGTAGTAASAVVTVQGIASMTKLLVTPDANSAVNVAQMNGTTVTMGNGASGTGVQRVTVANDSTGVIGLSAGTNLVGKVSASNETSTLYNATTALTPKWAKIATSSSGASELVALVSAKKLRVVALALTSNGTVNVKFQSHVTPTDLTGLFYEVANTGFVLPYNPLGWFETVAGEALDINLSAGTAVGGVLQYVEV